MASMILATCGWSLWWLALAAHRYAPALFPGLLPVYLLTGMAAAIGLFLAIFTVRARLIWVLLAGVPIMANGTLLMLPIVVDDAALELFGGDEESSRAPARGQGAGAASATIHVPVTAVRIVSSSTSQAILPWSLRRAGLRSVAMPLTTGSR